MTDPDYLQRQLQNFITTAYNERGEAHREDRCIDLPLGCGGPVNGFNDELSAREYKISGFCQTCQNKVFTEPGGCICDEVDIGIGIMHNHEQCKDCPKCTREGLA